MCEMRERASQCLRTKATSNVTTQVDRLKVDRLKEKKCAIKQRRNRLDTLTGDGGMRIIIALQSSVFSLQPKHQLQFILTKSYKDV